MEIHENKTITYLHLFWAKSEHELLLVEVVEIVEIFFLFSLAKGFSFFHDSKSEVINDVGFSPLSFGEGPGVRFE